MGGDQPPHHKGEAKVDHPLVDREVELALGEEEGYLRNHILGVTCTLYSHTLSPILVNPRIGLAPTI